MLTFVGSIKPPPVSSKHKPSSETSTSIEPPKESSSVAKTAKAFTFRELATATKNFRSDCLLGEGGFGRVYKGKLENGQVHIKTANNQTFYVGKICTFIWLCAAVEARNIFLFLKDNLHIHLQ